MAQPKRPSASASRIRSRLRSIWPQLDSRGVEGTTAPPAGRDEYLGSIRIPSTMARRHLDLVQPVGFPRGLGHSVEFDVHTNVCFRRTLSPGCYSRAAPGNTICVPEPTTARPGNYIDSVGDRFMPRMSLPVISAPTSHSWSAMPCSPVAEAPTSKPVSGGTNCGGSGTPALYQDGTVSPDRPCIASCPASRRTAGNAAVGYSMSSSGTHPGIALPISA